MTSPTGVKGRFSTATQRGLRLIEGGSSVSAAARKVRVSPSTLFRAQKSLRELAAQPATETL